MHENTTDFLILRERHIEDGFNFTIHALNELRICARMS